MQSFLLLVHSDKWAEDGNTRKHSAEEYNKQIKSRALLLHCVKYSKICDKILSVYCGMWAEYPIETIQFIFSAF